MKAAVISGGTQGLGRELSLQFSRAGFFVVALYRADRAAAKACTEALQMLPGKGVTLQADVTDPEALAKLSEIPELQQASELVVIHNACTSFTPQPMHLHAWENFDQAIAVSIHGAWNLYQALIRLLLRGRGAFVNILSLAAKDPIPKGFSPYVVAKQGLRGFTQSLACEYSSRGLRVFSVSPPFMVTRLTNTWDSRFRQVPELSPEVVATQILRLVEGEASGQGEDHEISLKPPS